MTLCSPEFCDEMMILCFSLIFLKNTKESVSWKELLNDLKQSHSVVSDSL